MEHKTTMAAGADRFVTPTVAFSGKLGHGKFKDKESVSLMVPTLEDAAVVNLETSTRAHRFNYPATNGDYLANDYAAQGIILEFDMDDADGAIITDNVQGLVLDEIDDPTYRVSAATAGLGHGVTYDGTDDAHDVAFANAAAAAPYTFVEEGDFSVEIVFATSADSSGDGDTLVCCRDGAAGIGWQLFFDAADHVDFHVDDGTEVTLTGATDVDTGSIVHVVVSLTRAGNGVIYVNGVADDTTAITGATGTLLNPSADTRFAIGGDAAQTAGDCYTGEIFFVRVYNFALTAAQALENYNVLMNQGFPGWVPKADPVDGDDLVLCKSGSDPNEFDLTEYMGLNAVAFRAVCSVQQTGSGTDLDFVWVFSDAD